MNATLVPGCSSTGPEFDSHNGCRIKMLHRSQSPRINLSNRARIAVRAGVATALLCSGALMLGGCGAQMVAAAGSATPGKLVVSSTAVSFGTVAVGQTASSTVSVSNSGSAAVHLTQLSLNGQSFSVANQGNLPITVEGGAQYDIAIQFSPKSAGNTTGQLSLVSDAANGGTAQVALSGAGQASEGSAQGAQNADLTVSAASLAFGEAAVHTPVKREITIRSSGNSPLTVSGISATGTGFSVSGVNLPMTLAPQQAAILSVQFDPTSAGLVSGSVNISSNAASGTKKLIALSGTGVLNSALSALSCKSASYTGASTDSCTVSLSGPAPTGGMKVSLGSSAGAVKVPSAVTIAAGSDAATFSVSVNSVASAERITLTATSGTVTRTFALQLNAATPKLSLSTADLAFGNVSLNQPVTKAVTLSSSGNSPLTISAAALTGKGFTISGLSFPQTLDPGKSATLSVRFDPTGAGAVSGSVTFSSDSTTGAKTRLSLTGAGEEAAALSGITCAGGTFTGAATDVCTVTLSGPAPSGGVVVGLSSNSTAVKVPASVTVAAHASSAQFDASILAVTTVHTVTLTAKAASVGKSYALQLNVASPKLSLSTANLGFGSVPLNKPATQTVTLSSTGTYPLTISGAAVSGKGYTVSGATFPLTIYPDHSSKLLVQFVPSTTGAVSGSLTLTSNSSTGTKTAILLSGTGEGTSALSSVTCASGTLTGAATDLCTVTLSGPASSGGVAVALSSSSGAVKVPASVTIAANASSAPFHATISAVTTAQTVSLTAKAGSLVKGYSLHLDAATPKLSVSAAGLAFGNVSLNQPVTKAVTLTSNGTAPLTISAAALSGKGFTMSGLSFPLTLDPGKSAALSVRFDPTSTGAVAGSLNLTSNSSTGAKTSLSLSGTGEGAGVLSSMACASSKISGAAADVCTVTLSGPAPGSGVAVALSSSSSAVKVPGSVNLSAGATKAQFTATVTAVTSAQSVTLTAKQNTVAAESLLQLTPATAALTISSTSISFGSVQLNTPATQSVLLQSSGTVPVTITAAAAAGKGFSMSGISLPLSLNPGQSASLDVEFNPTAAGPATGTVTLTSNASPSSTASIALSGTGGTVSYEVDLGWQAPGSSADPIATYNIYRSTSGGPYSRISSSPDAVTSYADSSVQSGKTYNYEVTSVDASGNESGPSNIFTAAIP